MKRLQLQLWGTPYWLGNILEAKVEPAMSQEKKNRWHTSCSTQQSHHHLGYKGTLNLISWSISAQDIPNSLEI